MGLELQYIAGQTPLDDDEKEGLLIDSVTTRGELDEFEQKNIEDAIQWTLKRSTKRRQLFSEAFIKELHKKMYGDVWAWAGTFRKSDKNIGVDRWKISTELKALLDDCSHWIAHSIYPADEIAIRFKHRLVSIHCFPNGNGRHSRLMADIVIETVFKRPVFTWGAASLVPSGNERSMYLQAIKAADKGNYELLLFFARS